MNKRLFAIAALTISLWATRSRAADEPSAAQPSATQAPSSQPSAFQPSMGSAQSAQTPPANWTSLKGTVQSVDPSAKTLQIKDETGNLVQVPVEKGVTLKKNGEKIKLSQVQTGDTITLAKRRMSTEEKNKSMAN